MNEMTFEANLDNLEKVLGFVDEYLESVDCGMKAQMQIDVAVEELFVNVAKYAYQPGTGDVVLRIELEEAPHTVAVTFIDSGVPFNPLAKADPDITLSAEEREIGGLGIFMVKKSMDGMEYRYEDGKNILTIRKRLSA